MKKLISLILALVLALTAVSALAEVTEAAELPEIVDTELAEKISSAELEALMDALEPDPEDIAIELPPEIKNIEIEATNEDVAGEGENTLLARLTDAESGLGLDLTNMYADETVSANIFDKRADQTEAVDLAETVPVVPMDLPAIVVTGEVEKEQEDVIIEIEVETNQLTNDFLEQFNTEDSTLYAVFTYEADGKIVSCIIDYEIKSDDVAKEYSIVYKIPLGVLADASGAKPFVNFVVETNTAEEAA